MLQYKTVPQLIFHTKAEEAVNFYISTFKNSYILDITYFGAGERGPEGSIRSITFELAGRKFEAVNGGLAQGSGEGLSLYVHCDSQQEIDELWNKLSEGGEIQDSGWVKDKFGVSWQISTAEIENMVNDPDPEKSSRVVDAILGMTKLDIATLREVYEGTIF